MGKYLEQSISIDNLNIVSDASWREVCMTYFLIHIHYDCEHFHSDFLIYNNNNNIFLFIILL